MKVGVVLPMATADVRKTLAVAVRAEALGFDGVFAFDHLFPPGAPSDHPSLEAFAILAAVGATTRRVRIGSLVARASLRSPGLLAKQATGLDAMTRARMILGIGSGDSLSRAEHEVYGVPYLGDRERREHLAETVRALKALFATDPWRGGEHVPPVAGPLLPPPRPEGGPPIWIGGRSQASVRLAGREADGWNGWGLTATGFSRRCDLLRRTANEAGRTVEATWAGIVIVGEDEREAEALNRERRRRVGPSADVWAGSAEALTGWIDRLGAAGASWAILLAAGTGDRMGLIAELVLPRVRRA